MSIAAGTRVGVYEVVAQVGAGGMGEVYRAHDTRLNRDVALKVLPEAFARDTERMARFEREAKLLASLNHPNIAAIYGLEESGPIRALVMELVEGPTLAERIAAGPIPVDEALPIARQIADAVEYAHEQNVIHRDLKPANIKVTDDGVVKVLDFGLAKALADDPTADDIGNSPTLSMAATRQGVILGTAAYMSPEQARGKKVDRRTDIWAFGCVLYEMLTGKQAFHGEDVTEVLAAVVMKEPAFDALPASTPLAIRTMLRRCMEKSMRRRLMHVGEARVLLEDVISGAVPAAGDAVVSQRKSRERLLGVAAAIALILAASGWGAFAYFRPAARQGEAIRFVFSPPDGWSLSTRPGTAGDAQVPLAVSPDGKRVAFVGASADGKSLIWVRSLDTLVAQSLAGTEGAMRPFWSPDNRFLAFFADGKLKKIDVAGGPPVSLCDVPSERGGSWGKDGVIVFGPSSGSGLMKVSSAGGVPSAATTLAEGEAGHFQPYFLPDGRHFVYRGAAAPGSSGGAPALNLSSLDSAERKLLLNADAQVVAYSRGHLLFLRETTLMAQPFDMQKLELTGEPFPIAEDIRTTGGAAPYAYFSASENGVLAYQTGGAVAGSRLTWFDRTGKQIGVLSDTGLYSDVELSPDGKQASVSILDPTKRTSDIWIYDVARGLKTRFTFDPADELPMEWSPDGKQVVFNSRRKGHLDLYQKAADGTGTEELLYGDNLDKFPASFSPDGKFLLYAAVAATGYDLFVLPLSGERKPVPFVNTSFSETPGGFSSDGRWVAYASNESGRTEVYVAPFPGPGGKRQVSTSGGTNPRWRSDGSEIFYLAPDTNLMAAAVNGKGASFEVGEVKPLFQTRRRAGGRLWYDVSLDGQRFLVNTTPEQAGDAPITVVVNWTAGMNK